MRKSKLKIRFNMKGFRNVLYGVFLSLFTYMVAEAQVSGTVYRDYNANGQKGEFEHGLPDITVKAFGANGSQIGATVKTDNNGNYTINVPAGTQARVEFSGIPSGTFSGPAGTGSGTTVQFVAAPKTGVNLAASEPANYCEDGARVVMPCYINGNPLSGGSAGSADVLVSLPYDAKGANHKTGGTDATVLATGSQVGATYGLAFQKKSQKMFSAAFIKRHSGLGPLGIGGLYATDMTTNTTANFINLSSLGLDFGTDPHKGLPSNKDEPNNDPDAFDAVGKVGMGDIDLSDDGKTLFVTNLKTRSIHAIFINSPAVTPTANDVKTFPVTNPLCSGQNDFRPFGLKFWRGKLYVGVVCSGESSQSEGDVKGFVYEMDPVTGASKEVINFSFNYFRYGYCNIYKWRPWTTTQKLCNLAGYYPQPIIGDIEFDGDGAMILGIMDRSGHQYGNKNYGTTGTSQLVIGYAEGDILRAGYNGTKWVLESNGSIVHNGVTQSTAGAGNNEGPGGGEYYHGDATLGLGHHEISMGSLSIRLGTGEVLTGAIDPLKEYVYAGGLRRISNTTGAELGSYQLYSLDDPGSFGKASGLGDMEILCGNPAIEVGNRVWLDKNGNGRQDSDEPGIGGVKVELYKAGAMVGTTTTGADGSYYFNSGSVTGGIKELSSYEIRVPLAGPNSGSIGTYSLTQENGSGISDEIDSDAIASGSFASVSFTTGASGDNAHTYDFGFTPCPKDFTKPSAENAQVCEDETIKLMAADAGTGATYAWEGPESFTSTEQNPSILLAKPLMSGVYTLKVSKGECFGQATVSVTVNPKPTFSVKTGAGAPTCSTDLKTYSFGFTATGGTVTVSVGKVGTGVVTEIPTATDVVVTVTSAEGCKITSTVKAPNCACPVVNPPKLATGTTPEITLCEGETIPTLTTTIAAGETVDWYTVATGGTPIKEASLTFVPTTSGTYYAEARHIVTGCKSATRTAIKFTLNPKPIFVLTPPTAQLANPACSGDLKTYSVNFTTDGTLKITPAVGKLGTNKITEIPSGVDIVIEISSAAGCKITQSIKAPDCKCPIVLVPALQANGGSNKTICDGQPIPALVVTTTGAGETVDWYSAATGGATLATATATYTPTAAGTYYAEARHIASGCVSSTRAAVTLTIKPKSTISIKSVACSADLRTYNISLSATNGAVTTTAGILTDNGNGNYDIKGIASGVNVTITAGTDADCKAVQAVNAPDCACPFIAPPSSNGNKILCEGDALPNLSVGVGQGETADWYLVASGGSPVAVGTTSFQPAEAGSYYVEARNITTNCKSATRTPVNVVINKRPTATPDNSTVGGGSGGTGGGGGSGDTGAEKTICEGEPMPVFKMLVGGPNETVDWYRDTSGGIALISGSVSFTPTGAGIYYAEARNTLTGCKAPNRIPIRLNIKPKPSVVASSNATPTSSGESATTGPAGGLCQGQDLKLTATGATGATYQWAGPSNFASATQNPVIQKVSKLATGTYTVTINKDGCTNTSTVEVLIEDCFSVVQGAAWNDGNKNGMKDPGEEGIGGVAVTLFKSDGTQVANVVTDTDGKYLFKNVMPADYYLVFSRPAGYTPSARDQGGDDARDSDADPVSGRTITFTVEPKETGKSWDAGFYNCASVSFKYEKDVYCASNISVSPIFITGSVQGTFSASPSGLSISSSTGIVNLGNSRAGVYTVKNEVPAVGSCPALIASYNITVVSKPNAEFCYKPGYLCPSSLGTQTVASPILNEGGTKGKFTSSPSLGAALNQNTGVIIVSSNTTPGIYTITNTIPSTGDCPEVVATTVITIGVVPGADFSYRGNTYCTTEASDKPSLAPGSISGSFSAVPAGLAINAVTGEINFKTSKAGTYTVTNLVEGDGVCQNVKATAIVTVVNADRASFRYSDALVCNKLGKALAILDLGSKGGVFTANPSLGAALDAVTGNISLSPTIKTGTYTITNTIPAANGCAEVSATTTINIGQEPKAEFNILGGPFCVTNRKIQPLVLPGSSAGIFTASPTGLSIDPTTGEINLGTSRAGTYTVKNFVEGVGACEGVFSSVNITITNSPIASFEYSQPVVCGNAGIVRPVFSPQGQQGMFSAFPSLGASLDPITGNINVTTAVTPGTYTITNTVASSGNCPEVKATATIKVLPKLKADFSYRGTYCINEGKASVTLSAGSVLGNFTAIPVGLSLNNINGDIDLASSKPGVYTVTNSVSGEGDCPVVTANAVVTIVKQPKAEFCFKPSVICNRDTCLTPIFLNDGAGGVFSAVGLGGALDPKTGRLCISNALTPGTYKITNTIPASGNCEAITSVAEITIIAAPKAKFSYRGGAYCRSEGIATPILAKGSEIGEFTASPEGLSLNTVTGEITLATSRPGTYTVYNRIDATGSCPAVISGATISIQRDCLTEADLSLTKTCSFVRAKYGEEVGFTLTVKNSGPGEATGIEIRDYLSADFQFISSKDFVNQNGTLIAKINKLGMGDSKSLTLTAKLVGKGNLVNRAEIYASDQKDGDSFPGNGTNNGEDDEDKADIYVPTAVDISVLISANNTSPKVGEEVVYTVKVLNDGPYTATGIQIKDILPDGLVFVSSSDFKNENGVLLADIASLPANSSKTLTFTARVAKAGAVVNAVELSKLNEEDIDSAPGNALDKKEDDSDSVSVQGQCKNLNSPVIIANKENICKGESITIKAFGCDAVVRWSNGAFGSEITVKPSETTAYTAKCIAGDCISESSTPVVIKSVDLRIPTIATTKSRVCAGESVTITSNGCSGIETVKWSNGMLGEVITISPNNSLTLTASCRFDGCESPASNSLSIDVDKAGTPSIKATKTAICGNESVTLTATGCNGELTWSDGTVGQQTITVRLTTNTVYVARCTVGICTTESVPVAITVTPIKTPIVRATETRVCSGSVVILTATGCNGAVKWSNGMFGEAISVSPNNTSVYSAYCQRDNCESDASEPVTIYIDKVAVPTLKVDKTRICLGESVTLIAEGCKQELLVWSNGVKGAASITVQPTQVTTYTAKCVAGECANESAPITISIDKVLSPTISCTKTQICYGESITLTALDCKADQIRWSDGSTGSLELTVKPLSTTTYYATCKQGACASEPSNKITVSVDKAAVPTITADRTVICLGDELKLKAVGCTGTLKWSDGSSGSEITVKPSVATTYTAKCIAGACESPSSNELNIKVYNRPSTPTIACTKTEVCLGESITLSAVKCDGTVEWSNGQKGIQVTTTPLSTTTYTAVCSNGSECKSLVSNSIKVNVVSAINRPTTNDRSIACINGTTTDLTTTVTSQPNTLTGVFVFHTDASPTSPVVQDPKAVSIGTYYVFEKTGTCYSSPSKIVISADCNNSGSGTTGSGSSGSTGSGDTTGSGSSTGSGTTGSGSSGSTGSGGTTGSGSSTGSGSTTTVTPPSSVDVGLKLVANSSNVEVGKDVTFTMSVTNSGPNDANNVELRYTMPAGLQYVSHTATGTSSMKITIDGNNTTIKIDKLIKGGVGEIVYVAKVLQSGRLINKFEMLRLDQQDTNASNDFSIILINDPPIQLTDVVGISKVAGNPTIVRDGVYDIPFTITVTNMSANTVKKVQVKDDLSMAFGNGAVILSDKIAVTTDAGFSANTSYTGRNSDIYLLVEESSEIPANSSKKINFTVRIDVNNATTERFYNSAELINRTISVAGGRTAEYPIDFSQNGTNADPDKDGNPTNNNEPTPITLRIPAKPLVGVALAVIDSVRKSDRSYDVTYQVILKNHGNVILKNIQLTDSLNNVFDMGATFKVVSAPKLKGQSELVVNPAFDGKQNTNLLMIDTSQLRIGQADTLTYKINVLSNNITTPFLSTVVVKAIGGEKAVMAKSTEGFIPDPSMSHPTAISFPRWVEEELFVPEGFSPNGDNINDYFEIKGVNNKLVSVVVYNRYGNPVYTQDDYQNDWDGFCNTGIMIGKDTGLPDGTYYAEVRVEGKKPIIKCLTIAR